MSKAFKMLQIYSENSIQAKSVFVLCGGGKRNGMSVFGQEKWGNNWGDHRNAFSWIKSIVFNYVLYMA